MNIYLKKQFLTIYIPATYKQLQSMGIRVSLNISSSQFFTLNGFYPTGNLNTFYLTQFIFFILIYLF